MHVRLIQHAAQHLPARPRTLDGTMAGPAIANPAIASIFLRVMFWVFMFPASFGTLYCGRFSACTHYSHSL